MSLKSQKRTAARQDEGRGISHLQKQKEAIGKTFHHELMCLIVFGICVPLLIAAAIAADSAFIFVMAALFAFGFVMALRDALASGKVWWGIRKIEYASEETVKVSFVGFRMLHKPQGRYSSVFVCLILKTEWGEKYYYVCPGVSAERKFIKENFLNRPVSLCCYKDSKFIKRLIQY